MKLTPLDIQKQQFRLRFRGFDVSEVDSFLERVADELKDLIAENKAQREELKGKEAELIEFKERERVLKDTMVTAQEMIENLKSGARKQAELIITKAEAQAEKMLNEAHTRLAQIHNDIAELKRQRTQFETKFRAMLETHQKLLDLEKEEAAQVEELEEKLRYLTPGKP